MYGETCMSSVSLLVAAAFAIGRRRRNTCWSLISPHCTEMHCRKAVVGVNLFE
jgi:hypothetical protein